MRTVESVQEIQEIVRISRESRKVIALVPTMGFLHAGHVSLMQEARKRCDLLVLSIFVNPTQFGTGEDFEAYPRDLEHDRGIASSSGVDLILTPTASDMYPPGYQSWVELDRLTHPLCGRSRPGHFRGVCTVVAKLFNIVRPDLAFFGKKDWQQLAVIRRMVADLNMGVQVFGMPIVRETDGLAMSSRNAYLAPQERVSALSLVQSLRTARDLYRNGERSPEQIRSAVAAVISAEPMARIDYVEVLDGDSLEHVPVAADRTLVAVAVRIGKIRLIDNTLLGEDE